jgi:hypothetical protein
MKPVLIVGVLGNMGSRYRTILQHMGIPFKGVDIDFWDESFFEQHHDFHSVIIATPTDTHCRMIKFFHKFDIPILCEKPITMKESELQEIIALKPKLCMVCQYIYLLKDTTRIGGSHYNYFKTGKDGLAWDCISIIGLSDGLANISNTSPIWSCSINGNDLTLSDMDGAYCKMIRNWVSCPRENLGFIYHAHMKVINKEYNERSTDWHPSAINQH